MKKNTGFLKIASLAVVAAMFAMASCKDEERLTLSDTQDISEEAVTDSYFQDMDDMAGVAIEAPTDDQYSGGRTATTITIEDERFNCDGIVVTIEPGANSTIEHPMGVLTVDFGTTGCSDGRGNVRTGKLKFTYDGWRFQPGSTIVTEPINYTINTIKLEGTRTLTNVTGSSDETPKFNAKLDNGKATFVDGAVALRESDITWQWNRNAAGAADDELTINPASASGTTRGGRSYTVNVLEPLVYRRFCGIAVDGVKKYVIDNSKEITINYGDGECDKEVTITVNGVTRDINVN
jgi:hypothetical protein